MGLSSTPELRRYLSPLTTKVKIVTRQLTCLTSGMRCSWGYAVISFGRHGALNYGKMSVVRGAGDLDWMNNIPCKEALCLLFHLLILNNKSLQGDMKEMYVLIFDLFWSVHNCGCFLFILS